METPSENSGPGRLVTGGAWFLALMILSGFFWFFWGVIVSRVYGPSGYGFFSTAISIYTFLWSVIFGGVFEGLIHYGASYLSKKESKLSLYFSG